MKKRYIAYVNHRYVTSFGILCGSEELPPVDFDFCEPEVRLSEIQRVFLAKIAAAPFDDWTSAAEWTTRLSETSTDVNAIRALTVIGDKPAPAATVKNISSGRKVTTRKDHTINATVDEVTEDNHAFLQSVESGKRFKMWYETAGGLMFGGNDGIPIEISGDMVLARGAGENQLYNYAITWVSPTTEERCTSPIFGQTLLGTVSFDTTVLFDADDTPTSGDDNDFILAGGTNAVAKFQYNMISPAIGSAITMTIKVGGVLKLTMNTVQQYETQPFSFTDILGAVHTGIIASGDVNF